MTKLRVTRAHDDDGALSPEFLTNIGLEREAWQGREERKERRPGSLLINEATALLFAVGGGLLAVSFAAQLAYVMRERHQHLASDAEALALDALMLIFSLLALGLARAGLPAKVERGLILACAAGSGLMNYAAADPSSWRSVLAYIMPPVALAVVADRVISVVRRHYLGEAAEKSAWASLGRFLLGCARASGVLALYSLRFVLAPRSTASGARRWVLEATPLPELEEPHAPKALPAPLLVWRTCPGDGQAWAVSQLAANTTCPRCGADPDKPAAKPEPTQRKRAQVAARRPSKAARLVELVELRHGPLADLDLARCSKIATDLAAEVELHPATARKNLLTLTRAAHGLAIAPEPTEELAS